MRILHVNAAYVPFVGGAETYVQAMSERLAREGHSVTVATTDAAQVQCFWDPHGVRIQEPEAEIHGVRVMRSRLAHLPLAPWSHYLLRRVAADLDRLPFDSLPILQRLARYMPWVPDLDRALAGLRPAFDLVHAVNVSLEGPAIVAARYAHSRGLPLVVTPFVHVGPRAIQRYYTMPHQMALLQDADRVIVQTEIEASELVRLGVLPERIVRLGMGVDADAPVGSDGRRFRAELDIGAPIVTFMGAVTDDKGAVHLVRAMQRLWLEGQEAVLVLAGPSVTPTTFERVFGGLPEADRARIRRLGPVTGQLKQDMLAATDVFVLPSRVDSFGIVYLEAWTHGVPVIGCRSGGVPDVIEDGQDGLLTQFGDVPGLASAIASLLADPERRRAMGSRGKAKVEARYTWDTLYRRLHSVYSELATGHVPAPKAA